MRTIRSRSGRLGLQLCLALVIAQLLAPWQMLSAQAPAGYYDTVDSASSAALRQSLHEVIDDHTRFPYTDTVTDTWNILNLADEDPNNPGNILDVYRNASYPKISGGIGVYNREHSWPNSYGFPNDGSDNYPYTDCHHLFAADASYNSARSNKPFRYCDAGCTEQVTLTNNGQGGGSGPYPGNSNWTSGSFSTGTWETWIGRRGDIARAMFYMDLRYEGGNHGVTSVAEPDLGLTDDDTLIEAFRTGSNESMAFMGILSDLLLWHQEDPVDDVERVRNEVVYTFQGNRNPFIDRPEWAACLYSDVCVVDTMAPAAPQALVATARNGAVDLDWNANGEGDLAGYNVYQATAPGGPYTRVNGPLVSANAATDGTVTNGTTYFYIVTAVDTSGNESLASGEDSATPSSSLPDTTPPGAPFGLGATAGDTQVSLDWNANGEGDLAGYNVYRATAAGGPYGKLNGPLLTADAYVDGGLTNGTAYFYVVTAVDTSGNESPDSSEVSATPSAPFGGSLVLSEVLYDVSGTDDGLEWVELYNGGSSAVDLSAFSLGNGGTTYTTSVVQLAGILQPGQTFVVGGPTSQASNASPSFDQIINFSPDFQNSGTTADGVALFDVPAGQINGSTVPIDAVVYGGTNASGLIDETGTVGAPEVGDAPSGSSLERIDLAGAWQIQPSPTPNTTPLAASNTAPTVTITAPANGSIFTQGATVNLAATASDNEDGNISGSVQWSSSIDGALGTGANLATTLSVGNHTLTASVTDSGGLQASDNVSVTVNAANTAPTVSITAPANGATFTEGASVSLTATASDNEDGNISGSVQWSSSIDGALGSGVSLAVTLSVGTHTLTASVTDSGGLQASDNVSVTVNAVTPASGLVLSEVLYDVSGTDDGLEWVELFNAGSTAVDLSGYSLGNGGLDYTTSLVQLSGTVQPGQVFVVGGPTSGASNANPSFDQIANFNPDFQNSGTTADGVALFAVPAGQVTASTVPVDAVVYGGTNASGLIDETGAVGAPEVGDASSGSSLERVDLTGAWQIQPSPTPNATSLPGANAAPTVSITAPANGATFTEGESVSLTAMASDIEDGELSASVGWKSSLDGDLGTGASLVVNLSVGVHTLTASVVDSGSLQSTDSVSVTVNAAGPTPVTMTFNSIGAEDGWVRESSENSGVGGRRNSGNTGSSALRAGDNNRDRQYKAIVSFDTSSLPDGATVTAATLRLRRGTVTGTNPFSTHGTCRADIHTGGFGGSTGLANGDFEATATAGSVAVLSTPAANLDWSEGTLNGAGLAAVNRTGTTQFRIAFDLDDNDDGGNDYLGYYSGDNGDAANHPQLVVTYLP